MSDPIYPFSCGSQYGDWTDSNCNRCTKNADESTGTYRCQIQEALDVACFGDGTVSPEMARRMGLSEENKGRYGWPCAEVDWTEEWKAEWLARKRVN